MPQGHSAVHRYGTTSLKKRRETGSLSTMNHVVVALNRVGRTIPVPYPCSIKRPCAALAENRHYITTDDVIILFYWSKSSSSVPVLVIIIVYKVCSVRV